MKRNPTLFILTLSAALALALPACGGGGDAGGITMYASAKSGLVIRSEPSTSGKKLGLVPYRSEVVVIGQGDREETIAGETGRWAQIDHEAAGDGEAWVFGGFLTASEPDKTPAAPTVVSLTAGDVGCYVELDFDGRKEEHLAEFDICELPLVGKRVKFSTRKTNVMADSCQGDPECPDTETVEAIYEMQAL